MDVVNESSPAPRLGRAPFLVRFVPEFLSRLAGPVPGTEPVSREFNGLLFGSAETQYAVVQVFRPFSSEPGSIEGSGTARWLQPDFDALIARCKGDPELAGLKLLGWISAPNARGLQKEEIAFHEAHFSNVNDLAVVIRNEPAGYLSLDLYCRALDGSFSTEQHRWGVVRIPSASAALSPVEVPIRAKIHDDVYMRAYQLTDPTEDDEPVSGWKSALASRTMKAFSRVKAFKSGDKDESTISKREPEKSLINTLEGVTSMSQALQYATRGGAAAAPAKIKEQPPESRESVAEKKEGVQRIAAEGQPAAITSRRQPAPATPSEKIPAPPRGERAPALPTAEARSQALPGYSPAASQASGLGSFAKASVILPPATASELAHVPKKAERKLPWLAFGVVFAASTGGTFGFIYLKDAHANGTLPGAVQAVWPTPGLHLKIAKSGERVQLSWNRATPAARNAQQAILDINDGPDHRQIRLTAGEVANGSILYLPNTEDVVFRLAVHGAAGQNVSESIRVLGTSKPTRAAVNQARKKSSETPDMHPASSNPKIAANHLQLGGTRTIDPARLLPITRPDQRTPKSDFHSKNQVPIENRKVLAPATAPSKTDPRRDLAALATGNSARQAPDDRSTPRNGAAAGRNATDPVATNLPPAKSMSLRQAPPRPAIEASAASHVQQQELPESAKPPQQDLQQRNESDRTTAAQSSASGESNPVQKSSPLTGPVLTYRPPRPIKQVLPKVSALPPSAGDAAGEVSVTVRIDESGQVVDARLLETNDKVGTALRTAALSAAREWVFAPASLHGKNVASDHTILFHFRH